MALENLGPVEQLKAGKLSRRIVQLLAGLVLFGVSQAMLIRSTLGNAPWDVLHQGIALHTGFSIGTVAIGLGVVLLLLWIPLRLWPGLGTVLNTILIGVSIDVTLPFLPHLPMAGNIALMLGGVILNGMAGGLYIGAQFGAGPRDGLMTGLNARTGVSMRLIRTMIEVSVVLGGWVLGGTVGVGTVIYALAIGPLPQFFLEHWTVELLPQRSS